jgi:sugar phosphate permease
VMVTSARAFAAAMFFHFEAYTICGAIVWGHYDDAIYPLTIGCVGMALVITISVAYCVGKRSKHHEA